MWKREYSETKIWGISEPLCQKPHSNRHLHLMFERASFFCTSLVCTTIHLRRQPVLSLSPHSQSSFVQPYKPALGPIFSFCPPHLHLYNIQVPLGCSFGLGTLGRKFQGPGCQTGSRMGCHRLSGLTVLWVCGFLCSAGHGQKRPVRAFHSRALLSGEGQAALESASMTLPKLDLLPSSPLLPSHSKSL